MNSVPTKNGTGRPCVFRVVHVGGTIRKVEEEAIRRARNLIFEAKGEQTAKNSDPLSNIFSTSIRPARGASARGGPSRGEEHDSDVEMGEISEG